MLAAIASLSEHNPVCVIAGCTEIGIALKSLQFNIPIIDPLNLLANHIVEKAFA